MNRRQFLKDIGLLSFSLTSCGVGKKTEKKFAEFSNYVYIAEATAEIESGSKFVGNNNYMVRGIIMNNKYFTVAHAMDFSKNFDGANQKVLSKKISLYNRVLKELFLDEASDIAIYSLPSDLKLSNFPAKPSNKINLGDKVHIIGKPGLYPDGVNHGVITDIDGLENVKVQKINPEGKNWFGTSVYIREGDSGSPLLNDNFELFGLTSFFTPSGSSYFIRIEEFLKRI